MWSAKSPKPTSLLVVTTPDMKQALRAWQIAKELSKGISIGLDQAGGWSTAVLKEYPPALNGRLAAVDAIGQCSYDSKLTVPISFSERYDSMMWTDYGRHIGQDFAG